MEASAQQAIRDHLTEELVEVEVRFSAELSSDLSCVNSLIAHVERYRGKMLRPMLVLVSGMASSPTGQDVTEAHRVVATVVEMVHMATLVHDDILDEADVRRRGSTINHLRGNETAVMLGDYLISHAFHLCSSLDSLVPDRLIADATNSVCEGELLQLANRENWDLDEATYFEIIRRKTASLCGTCCRLGGLLNNAAPAVVEGLYACGERMGSAFQIIDDVLDITGDPETVGKTLGRDLDKGKLTLPLIHHLVTANPASRAKLLECLQRLPGPGPGIGAGADNAQLLERVRSTTVSELLRESGSVEYANALATQMIGQAKESLSLLPESPARTLLFEMADAVLTRKF